MRVIWVFQRAQLSEIRPSVSPMLRRMLERRLHLPYPQSCNRPRPLTTSARGYTSGEEQSRAYTTLSVRIVPTSPSYFTAQPDVTDSLLRIEQLQQRFETLPTVPSGEAPRVAWLSLVEYRRKAGEDIKASRYAKIRRLLQRMNLIDPSVMPPEVRQTLDRFKRDFDPSASRSAPPPIDRYGRTLGVGRRKSSTAQVWLVEGEGEVLINGKSLAAAFARIHDRESALWALKMTGRIDKYNVWALVRGGGTTGQAEAMTLGVAKALLGHEPSLKAALRRGRSCSWSSDVPLSPLSHGVFCVAPHSPFDRHPRLSGYGTKEFLSLS